MKHMSDSGVSAP
uniref:Uncharacterized protein n=1 Tax=Lepeophtheirus salmonis TaxID=72036 RepID=A0A0K2TYG8_LEPSM